MSGLLTRLGHLDPETGDYRGAHALRFSIHPASVLAKRKRHEGAAEWIMAGELVDTSRLMARDAAVIDPAWIEQIAGHVCKHSYHSPEWDAQSGFVRAHEQVTLYGLIIVRDCRRDSQTRGSRSPTGSALCRRKSSANTRAIFAESECASTAPA